MERMDSGNGHENTFSNIRNSLGSPSNIYNPESQLLSEMIKDNRTFHSKKSSISLGSFVDDNQSQEHEVNLNPFSNINIMDDLSIELSRRFLLDSEDESNTEENSKEVNELLSFKRKSRLHALTSAPSETDNNDGQSSVYTDNGYGTETQTETQSEYSVTSSRDYKFDPEPLKNRIWYYKKTPDSGEKYMHNIHNIDNQMDDAQSYSDDSSTMDDSTAAIMQLKLHHYVSTNNLKVNKKDNNNGGIKRRTTISYSKFKPNFDYTHDINDIPLFSNKEFKTEAKENYHIADKNLDDYNTSLLLNMTGDASKKRRSQINQRNRSYSHNIINENSSTISLPLSNPSFKKSSNNSFSNVSNSNKKQHQLNNPIDHSLNVANNVNVTNKKNVQATTTATDNSNQLYKVLMMAKDHILSLGGKIKRSDSIRSTASRRSSIRKLQKVPKRHSTRRHHRQSVKSSRRKRSINSLHQSLSLTYQSEDEMTTVSSITDADKSIISQTSVLKKKSSNPSYSKTLKNKTSGPISRTSSIVSASTRRSSLYSKNKFYQNDQSINYSASNLSESSMGIDLEDSKKYDESFELDIHNNSKNNKLRVYGVYPESFYSSEYHEPVVSSIDGRSSIYDDDEEASIISESDNMLSSYTTNSDIYNNEIYDIRNKLNMKPLTKSVALESPLHKNVASSKDGKKENNSSKSKSNESNKNSNSNKNDNDKKGLKKPISTSTIETNLSSESLTPTITDANVNHYMNDTTETRSELTADRATITGSAYGDTKSNATVIPRMMNNNINNNNNNNYDALYNYAGIKRNWDNETESTFSRFNENDYRHPLEIASMPDGIRESNNTVIKQIPLPYYRYGVYMYITDPVIVQTRTMMERMFSAHTLYTITVKLLRPNLPMYRNDKVCTFTVHKRYRQFRSFYKEIHKKYKDTINDWPEFPKKTFFDRFDSSTIKDRAFAFSSLMSFISLHPLLYNCPVLLTFLEITGSMNNPFSNINSNISKRQGPFDKSAPSLEGKTIQFEGRNVAPSIPKIFGSMGRRQYPPGFYGHGQVPQSYYDQSITSFSSTTSNSIISNSSMSNGNVNGNGNGNGYSNYNNSMQLKRRSMYGKIENNYYSPDYYSSFTRPQITKMRTTEFLKNRNSFYSNGNESETHLKSQNVSNSKTKIKDTTISTSSPSLKNNNTNNTNSNNNNINNNKNNSSISNSSNNNSSSSSTTQNQNSDKNKVQPTRSETPTESKAQTSSQTITQTNSQNQNQETPKLSAIEASTNNELSNTTHPINPSPINSKITINKSNDYLLVDQKPISPNSTGSSNVPTPKLSPNTPVIDTNQKTLNESSTSHDDSSLLTPVVSTSTSSNSISSSITTTTANNTTQNTQTSIDTPTNNRNSTSPTKELESTTTNNNDKIQSKLDDSNEVNTNNTFNNNTISDTNNNSSSTSSTSSSSKGKNVATDTKENNNNNNNNNNKDEIPPGIPRPRPRPRMRNPVVYRNMDEMDMNYMRYNHYQQIKEIPGFQYLISEFPKLRNTQNKRYSSIF